MSRAIKGIFITGTDTGVGKTVITGLLARYYNEQNRSVITQKLVQTGSSLPVDFLRHQALAKVKVRDCSDVAACAAGYCFRHAGSPHLSARLEKKKISSRVIKQRFNTLADIFDLVIVEGAGGALVPYSQKRLLIDIVQELHLPVIIVARNALGAINHTLLTIEALRSRGMDIIGVIFNCCDRKADTRVIRDNPKIVARISEVPVLGSLSFLPREDELYAKFKPIARTIARAL